ncbi:Fis family transcriptional regulator [Rhodanobacter sp. C05]|nr:Fis family transcriptional regulator [Rhodanobacter sp. C05]
MSNRHIGGDFDDFLALNGILEESTAIAMKRVIAWQIQQEMKAQKISKSKIAVLMGISRSRLDSLLDESDVSPTLKTLASAAIALGKKLHIELAA